MIAIVPPQASSLAGSVDTLFDVMLALTGTVSVAVFVVMIVFCVKYRRRSHADRTGANRTRVGVEITWTLVPFVMFMALFGWSISLWSRMRTPPADAAPIYVVAKQWMWKVQHPGGQREIDSLHVPLDRPIRLVMTSQDVIHSFYVPAFRQKQDVLPGRYTQLWFTATREGDYPLLCSQYCGTDHARMTGTVSVMKPADYARWLQAHASTGLAEQGAERFRRFGCSGCHDARSTVHAPDLAGLYGRAVHLQDGRTIVADDAYIRDSILLPKRDVVAGFDPIMPSFQGQVSEADILDGLILSQVRKAPT